MRTLSRAGAGGLAGAVSLAVVLTGSPAPAFADDAQEARQLVEKARLALENFTADPNMDGFRSLVKRARGVYITPQVLRAALILDVSGGSGVPALAIPRKRLSGLGGRRVTADCGSSHCLSRPRRRTTC